MHLDQNNERTPSNKRRLKLKDFHKRQILGKIIKNLFANRKSEKPRKEPHGSGSGGNNNVRGCFRYRLKSIAENVELIFGLKYSYHTCNKQFIKTFNKQQLPGKLILINGKYFRIC